MHVYANLSKIGQFLKIEDHSKISIMLLKNAQFLVKSTWLVGSYSVVLKASCWFNNTPFLSPQFQHSIFLRLAHKFIQQVTDDKESQVLQHSCTVWKNGIFWSTLDEVDFQIQTLSSKATVQVLVRSRNGILPLMKEVPKVIQEVIKLKEHHYPNMKTVSVVVKVKGGIPSGVQAPVSSIIKTVEKGGTAVVPYGNGEITTIPLSEFFYDWGLSQDCVPVLKQMNQTSVTEHSPEGTYTYNECVFEKNVSVVYNLV